MKILLINPNWDKSKKTIWFKIASVYPPLGLLNVAGVLEKAGHDVSFIDMTAENLTPKDFNIDEEYDLVGITMTTPLYKPGIFIAKKIKEKYPHTKIVLGGVHATMEHKELIGYPFVDIIVREEGEITMSQICDGTHLSNIQGITYKKDGFTFVNKSRPQLEDINWLPMIPYHLLKMDLYRPPIGGYKNLPAFMMITTRNCPNDCKYCQHYHRRIKCRDADKIFAEIKHLKENYGVKEINFYDDTMTIFKSNVQRLCDLIITNKLSISWTCFTRVNVVDKELLENMKSAGCHLILFGVESSNPKILKDMRKNITLDQVKKAVTLCREVGIKTRCSYIFGYPGETEESMRKTLEFSKQVDSDSVQYNAITAYPGTDLWKEADEKGYLVKTNSWDVSNCNIETPWLSREKVLDFYKTAHRKFYFRPKIIWRRISSIRSFSDLKQELNGALALIS
jgi:anaerobic magnesium-protoporphyrin IX monomethyl ester cyclase